MRIGFEVKSISMSSQEKALLRVNFKLNFKLWWKYVHDSLIRVTPSSLQRNTARQPFNLSNVKDSKESISYPVYVVLTTTRALFCTIPIIITASLNTLYISFYNTIDLAPHTHHRTSLSNSFSRSSPPSIDLLQS
jgi:hypothetical protein